MNNPLPFLPSHYNRGLFSDYYLNNKVPTLSEWLPLLFEAEAARDYLRALWRNIPDASALDEAQLEAQWIQPVLQRLGHQYSVQLKIRFRETGYRKPDYGLTASAEAARALTSHIYSPAELREAQVIAVADAKAWGVPLDQSTREQRNPSQQIDEYLRYSELDWGILTDGRMWRLYEQRRSKHNAYYAVDLIDLLQRDDPEAFLYFYAFFRQAAFTGTWLDDVLKGSVDYAERLSETLEEQVYDALELVAQGFLDYRRNRLNATPETLLTIYEQSLVLLYRLLFVFYAESREVLPYDERSRQSFSLAALKQRLARTSPQTWAHETTSFYCHLNDLFFIIDQGDPQNDFPAYNGHLFSAEDYPFLADKAIGDRLLGEALDLLARVPDKDDPAKLVNVDYQDLDVRHLGAIYEKLLEYQLDIATEALALTPDGKYAPAQDSPAIKQAGQVYLKSDNNERKITGSYYTPDFIVRFMVERSLDPLLRRITERHATADVEGHWHVVPDHAEALINEILALNILDPAIGSGHFLVEVTGYMAEWLRSLALAPADMSNEDELIYWKRQVVNACIYGVDLNPLAVELAKLALWLATLAEGKPLSFLDHHLKIGNSLVGATLREIGLNIRTPAQERRAQAKQAEAEAAGQLALLDDEDFAPAVGFAVDKMAAIEGVIAESVADVKTQEALYADLSAELQVWKHLADVWLARYFGLELDQNLWAALRVHVLSRQEDDPVLSQRIQQAAALAQQHYFFHWELEFPEIFFDPDGQARPEAGFDVVIGNPPYVRQERIKAYKPFLQVKYGVYQGTADLFLYFYERGLKFLKADERLAFITAGTYMNTHSATAFRQYIHGNAAFDAFVDFGSLRLFKGVDLATTSTITILKKAPPAPTFRALFVEDAVPASLSLTFKETAFDCLSEVTGLSEWRFQRAELTQLFRKVTEGYATLLDVIGKVYSGIKTGLNEAFIVDETTRQRLIDQDPTSAEIIKPMRRGQDLRPWYQINSHHYLVFAYQGIEIDRYPAIRAYLEPFKEALSQRSEPLTGQCQWYELRPCDYYDVFENHKLLWPDISKFPRFSRNVGYYLGNTAFVIPDARYHLLALLQSRVLWYVLSQIATPISKRAGFWQYRAIPQFVERLPIPDLTPDHERELSELAERLTDLARQRYQHHEATRHRIQSDVGQGAALNNKLSAWWELDGLSELRGEVQKAFGADRDIPLRERGDWEGYLQEQQAEHQRLTGAIVALETRLNAVVYAAFKLTAEEQVLIEQATAYPYGAV